MCTLVVLSPEIQNLSQTDFVECFIHAGEGQEAVSLTSSELRPNVALIPSVLRVCGVRQGDCVVGYLPNSSLAMLASVSIGAVWSSTSPDRLRGLGESAQCVLLLIGLPVQTLAFAIPTVLMLKVHSSLYTHYM